MAIDNKLTIFLTGATGYVGGTVLDRFLTHSDFAKFNLLVYVRSQSKADKLAKLGVTPILGENKELDKLEKYSSQSDVVVDMSDSDGFEAAKAVLRGLKARHEATGQVPTYIHTSGVGVLADDSFGNELTDKVYNDSLPEDFESLAYEQVHRNVDTEVVKGDAEGYCRTYIVLPSYVYGTLDNQLVKLGIQNSINPILGMYIGMSLGCGQGVYVGAGKNEYGLIHNNDLADLFIALFNSIRANPDAVPHGREGYFFGENGAEFSWKEFVDAMSSVLAEEGKISSPTGRAFTTEELNKYMERVSLQRALGGNARCKGVRSRALGWMPSGTREDFFKSLKDDTRTFVQTPEDQRVTGNGGISDSAEYKKNW